MRTAVRVVCLMTAVVWAGAVYAGPAHNGPIAAKKQKLPTPIFIPPLEQGGPLPELRIVEQSAPGFGSLGVGHKSKVLVAADFKTNGKLERLRYVSPCSEEQKDSIRFGLRKWQLQPYAVQGRPAEVVVGIALEYDMDTSTVSYAIDQGMLFRLAAQFANQEVGNAGRPPPVFLERSIDLMGIARQFWRYAGTAIDVSITFDAMGVPSEIRVGGNHPGLATKLEKWIEKWRIQPSVLDGELVPTQYTTFLDIGVDQRPGRWRFWVDVGWHPSVLVDKLYAKEQ